MRYTQAKKRVGTIVTNGDVVEELNALPNSKKARARKAINEQVFDNEDSIADNAKMISLMLTMMSRLYGAMSDETKAKLDSDDRALIEYTMSKFASTNTRADMQFASDGAVPTIDKLLDRQAKIGEIVS